jgi:hypothetical protein
MPERWQQELEKLRTVGAPSTMRMRIDAGPTGDGEPPMPRRRQRIVAGVVAFAVFGGAIAFAWGAFGRSGNGTTIAEPGPARGAAVFTFAAHPTEGGANPTGTMTFDGQTVEAFGSSFCWDFGGGSMCADTIEPEFAASDFGSVPVGTTIAIEGDADSVEGHLDAGGPFPFDRIRSLDTSGDAAVLPTQAGRYIIEFDAAWSQGSRTFYFPIRIVDVASAPALVATLNAPLDGSTPGLSLSYGDFHKDFFAQGGSWPGLGAYDDIGQVFPAPLPSGAELRVDGDAQNVMAEIRSELSLGPSISDLDLRNRVAALPDRPGRYLLTIKASWQQGTVVFPVTITIKTSADLPVVSPPEVPSATPALPDLVGMTDQQAMKTLAGLGLTWLVAYRAVDGEQWRVVEMDPPPGSEITNSLEVRLVVATQITPLPAGAEDALGCPVADRVAFGGPHAVLLPAGEAFVRGNTGGIEKSDEVVQASSDGSSQLWHVIRDGEVIAVIDDQTLDGVACAGSGVGAA